jgi:hypothetical protein
MVCNCGRHAGNADLADVLDATRAAPLVLFVRNGYVDGTDVGGDRELVVAEVCVHDETGAGVKPASVASCYESLPARLPAQQCLRAALYGRLVESETTRSGGAMIHHLENK